MTDVTRYGIFVGGEFVPAHSGATFPVHNPHNDEVFAQVAEAREADVEDAIAAARAAFEGPWGALTPKERGKLLLRLARLIEDQGELIARLEAKNSGHPIRDVRRFDLVRTVDWFEYFAGMTTKIQGDVIPSSFKGVLNYTLREPLGVVAQIVPWNFPLMFVAWNIAPALAAGNTVILKPAEYTPLSALEIARLTKEAGFPPGAVNVVPGKGSVAGAALARHPGVDKICFTGSVEVGQQIMRDAAKGEGAEILYGGRRPDTPETSRGYYVLPTLVRAEDPAMRICQEEVFGPFITVTPFAKEDEALAIANGVPYGLGAGLWTQNLRRAHGLAAQLRAGLVWINSYNLVAPASPFGGMKMSGMGRERGFETIREYTQVKSVWVGYDFEPWRWRE